MAATGRSLPRRREPYAGPSGEELQDLEVRLLLQAIHERYGFDFRDYALSSLRRRIRLCVQEEGLHTVSALLERLLHDPPALDRFLATVSISVTAMFRDARFYRAFRQKVAPLLRTYPMVRIWHAGCSTGEEVYSMAMLLWEEGLFDRSLLYATDMQEAALRQAERGVFPLASMAESKANYREAGGKGSFSRFYTPRGEQGVAVRSDLKKNVTFARHNLVTDGRFNEFNVVLCRNVLIYFNRKLQDRVQTLLYQSLARFGFLGLGSKETIQFTRFERRYEEVDGPARIYRKVG